MSVERHDSWQRIACAFPYHLTEQDANEENHKKRNKKIKKRIVWALGWFLALVLWLHFLSFCRYCRNHPEAIYSITPSESALDATHYIITRNNGTQCKLGQLLFAIWHLLIFVRIRCCNYQQSVLLSNVFIEHYAANINKRAVKRGAIKN